ncbi:beta-1,3-galactosyltransferase 1 [Antennarius striatus]|uniref:beta-1,3-galactosyltransferase 1 n=1 Tax=Antennarius striatus TaxID=241820 RepID=UPI0035AE2824
MLDVPGLYRIPAAPPEDMGRSSSWRWVKLLACSALLVLAAQLLVCRVTLGGHRPPKPSPLPPHEYRILAPESYRYLLNSPAACRHRSPFLVLMVPVAPQETAAREAVRRTWGAPRLDTLTLFFVGLPPPGEGVLGVQAQLEEESRAWGDIVQMSFRDSYQNLTIKTLMMMHWLSRHCPHAAYAMKVDADIFLNVFHLLGHLERPPRRGFITGSVISDGVPRRDRRSKWFLSEEAYPEDHFPPYVSGAGYVFSLDLAPRISWASRFVRMIPLEDVYVGLCLRVLGVRPAYAQSLPTFRNLFEIGGLEYDRCTFTRLVIVNHFTPSQLENIWTDFSQGHQSC